MRFDDLIGIPFKNDGRDLKKGIDCWGLAMEIYRRNGRNLPEYWEMKGDMEEIGQAIQKALPFFVRVYQSHLPIPCLVMFKFNQKYVNHIGIYIGNGKFIHARNRIGVCIEKLDHPYWSQRFEGFADYKGG